MSLQARNSKLKKNTVCVLSVDSVVNSYQLFFLFINRYQLCGVFCNSLQAISSDHGNAKVRFPSSDAHFVILETVDSIDGNRQHYCVKNTHSFIYCSSVTHMYVVYVL